MAPPRNSSNVAGLCRSFISNLREGINSKTYHTMPNIRKTVQRGFTHGYFGENKVRRYSGSVTLSKPEIVTPTGNLSTMYRHHMLHPQYGLILDATRSYHVIPKNTISIYPTGCLASEGVQINASNDRLSRSFSSLQIWAIRESRGPHINVFHGCWK